MKVLRFLALVVLLSAGCSVFPGLRVLNGEDPAEIQSGDQVVAQSDLVMADKSGSTDSSLILAADRIEAASGNVDIIEIRRDEEADVFITNLLFNPPSDANGQTQEGLVSLYTAIQRAMELTWQGTMAESQDIGTLRVTFIAPQAISTLDNGGMSFVGFILLNAQIERAEAIRYLSGPRTLSDFLDLIANGTMSYESPEQTQLYQGQPNHPLFMLSSATAAATSN
jgi:hypothetical protein